MVMARISCRNQCSNSRRSAMKCKRRPGFVPAYSSVQACLSNTPESDSSGDIKAGPLVPSSSATEMHDRKLARHPARDLSKTAASSVTNSFTCTSSQDEGAFCRVQEFQDESKKLNQKPVASIGNVGASSARSSPPICKGRGGQVIISGRERSVLVWYVEERDQHKPIPEVYWPVLPATDSLHGQNKSWLQGYSGTQQAVSTCQSIRHVPNWSSVLRRSLPPTNLPQCHANAKEWPAIGYNQDSIWNSSLPSKPRTEELEICKSSVLNSRIRATWPALGNNQDYKWNSSQSSKREPGAKRRFRDLNSASSANSVQVPGLREEVKESALHGKSLIENEKRSCEPKLMMLNKDFMVISPVRDNLLVTIALTQRNNDAEEDQLELAVKERKYQVLTGRFTAFSSFPQFQLCRDALRVKFEQNAGGSSTISESLSVEYFARRFQAQDVVTEMEVEYWSSNWKKVDYICTLYGQRVGVSVTRAMSYPDPKSFSSETACRLLHKKLYGLVVAREGVSNRHSFCKCILHVWCETQRTAMVMKTMYTGVHQDLEISDDIIVVLTIADGLHARPIFYEHALHKR